jgi:hypothetical protein
MNQRHFALNSRRVICFVVLVIATVISASAFGSRDSATAKNQVIRGTVRIIGSEPHTAVAITTEDGGKSYLAVSQKNDKEIRDLQGHLIDFTVSPVSKPDLPIPPGIDGAVEVVSWKIVK